MYLQKLSRKQRLILDQWAEGVVINAGASEHKPGTKERSSGRNSPYGEMKIIVHCIAFMHH